MTTSTAVGTGKLAFTACDTGSLDYAFTDGSGRSGTIPLTRITPNVTCVTGSAAATTNPDFALSGNWFDPATSGQGFAFEMNPLAPVLFATWYTYALAGTTDASGQRWLTGQAAYVPGARSSDLTLYQTTEGVFDQVTNPAPVTAPVGTATVVFASCASAQLRFNLAGGSSAGKSGTISLVRVGPMPPGCGP